MSLAPNLPPSNPLLELSRLGQSVWLDFIRRGLLDSGGLERLVREDGVAGRHLEPGDLREGDRHRRRVHRADRRGRAPGTGDDPRRIYEALAVDDIRRAADVLARSTTRRGGARRLRLPRGRARSGRTTPRRRSPRRAGSGPRSTVPT